MSSLCRFVLFLAVGVCLCWVGALCLPQSAAAQGDSPLRVRLTLPKQEYLAWEEMPVQLTLTNVSPVAGEVRLPKVLASVALQVVDVRTNQPVRSSLKSRGPRQGPSLRLKKVNKVGPKSGKGKVATTHHQKPPAKVLSSAGGVKARRAPQVAPLIVLGPGESAESDYELLGVYGWVLPGRYAVRAVYVTEGVMTASDWVPFVVSPLPEQEEKAKQTFLLVRWASRKRQIELGESFLQEFPNSIFAHRVRREMLEASTSLKDWARVVELASQLRQEARWHGERQTLGLFLAEGLWHTGRQAEAEALLQSMDPADASYTLNKLRKGGK